MHRARMDFTKHAHNTQNLNEMALWPDKALVFETKDCRFEFCQGHCQGHLLAGCSTISPHPLDVNQEHNLEPKTL